MIGLAWRSVRRRWSTVAAAVLAVLSGAALTSATLLLDGSAEHASAGRAATAWTLGGADLVVRMPSRVTREDGPAIPLPEQPRLRPAQVDALARIPGVASVAVEMPVPAYLVTADRKIGDARKRSWGHPWTTALAEPVGLTTGRAPAGPDELVVDRATATLAGAAVGDRVTVLTGRGGQSFRLVGIGDWPGSTYEHALFFTPGTVVELGGQPYLALLTVAGGADPEALAGRVRRALPGVQVLTGDDRAGVLALDRRQAELAGGSSTFVGMMAASALAIAALVISSTVTVSVLRRRRELALLRTVGATPGRIRRLVLAEAAFVGAVGGTLGAGLGIGLARIAIDFFVGQGLLPRTTTLVVGAVPLLVGIGAAVLVAVLAGTLPAWRAARTPPGTAMVAVSAPPRAGGRLRLVGGLLCLGLAAAGSAAGLLLARSADLAASQVAGVLFLTSAPLLILASVLFGPVLLAGSLILLSPVLRGWAGGFLVLRQVRADLSRVAAVGAPLVLMVGFACLLVFQDVTTFEARSRGYAERLGADLVISGSEQLGLSPRIEAEAAAVPGVAAASGLINTRILVPDAGSAYRSVEAMAVRPATVAELWRLPAVEGRWADFDDGSLALARGTAQRPGWRVGEQVTVLLPDGTPVRSRLAVVYDAGRYPVGALLSRAMVQPHLVESFDASVQLTVRPDADPAEVAARLDTLRSVDPDLVVATRAGHLAALARQSSGDNWIVHLFVVLFGGYAGVAAINVLVGAVVSRRDQYAVLRLAGAGVGQVVAAVLGEVLVIVLGGIVVGTVAAALPLVGYGYAFSGEVWFPLSGRPYLLICGAAVLVGVVGAVLSAWSVARVRPSGADGR
ncbi:ABC transporter permease [Plantactinospora sonchi]|uniref:FtsX-like permease family protein n=1 Tax=Plantactinospora sonchi TaxID=1544735 RepID=A0ABU7RVD7_9ACTN